MIQSFSKSKTIFKLLCKKAFLKAWQDVCGSNQGTPTLIIPGGKKFMLQPSSFRGPCKSSTVKIMVCYK